MATKIEFKKENRFKTFLTDAKEFLKQLFWLFTFIGIASIIENL
jgi:hypothetical protein